MQTIFVCSDMMEEFHALCTCNDFDTNKGQFQPVTDAVLFWQILICHLLVKIILHQNTFYLKWREGF